MESFTSVYNDFIVSRFGIKRLFCVYMDTFELKIAVNHFFCKLKGIAPHLSIN